MLKNFTGAEHIYVFVGFTDMRKGSQGLITLVQEQFKLDPFSNSLFLFCGRKKDRLKALYYDSDGFVVATKVLLNGRYQWPKSPAQAKDITEQQYRWLMEGLSINQPKAIQPVKRINFY